MDSDGEDNNHELTYQERFEIKVQRVRNNDPRVKHLFWNHDSTNREWEDIGRDISNNTYLEHLDFGYDAVELDDEIFPSLFRGLSRSSSIIKLDLSNNDISATGLRSLEPFLTNSVNLREVNIWESTNIQTEGFNMLWQALRKSPVERLHCCECGITSIEIETVPNNLKILGLSCNNIQSEGFNRLLRSLCDSGVEVLYCIDCHIGSIDIDNDSLPRSLKELNLFNNRINSNGCRGIAKLLQEGGITLEKLDLHKNSIDDEGVAILVDALKTNTSLKHLDLHGNDGISNIGRLLMLQLVNDISSIKATLQSNHTLQSIRLGGMNDDIRHYINMARTCNRHYSVRAGREKVIRTQLHSQIRTELAGIQGVQHSLYSEIDPLHLPEVLSLVGRRHGQKELYVALKASIVEVMSTVNRKQCIQQLLLP